MTVPIISDLLNRVLPGERAEERESQAGSAKAGARAGTGTGNDSHDGSAQAASAASPPDPLLVALDGALSGLEQALDDFAWPSVMTPSRFQRLMREYVHEDWPDIWPDRFPGLRAVMGSDPQPAVQPDIQTGARRAMRSGGPNAGNAVLPGGAPDPRLEEDLRAIFHGPPPPVLAPALAGLAGDAQAVIMAYNRFRLLLVVSARRLRPELAEAWRSALVERASGLAWLGVEEIGHERILWARRREFLAGAARQPERAYDLLAGGEGLTAVWRETARQIRRQGLENFIVSPSEPDAGSPKGGAGLVDLSG